MPASLLTVYVSFGVQAALAVLLLAVLLGLYSHYRQLYLVHWALSSAGTAIYFLSAILALSMAESQRGGSGPVWLALSFVEFLAIYWAAAFLLFGAWDIAERRLTRRMAKSLLVALAVLALAVVLADGLGVSREIRVFARQGVRALLTGAAYVASAVLLLRTGAWTRRRGLTVVSLLFLPYGLLQLYNVVLALPLFRAPAFAYYLGFFNVILAAAVAVAMVVGMLEQERDRGRVASEQIEHLAYHDGLTGLPNRALFTDRLTLALAQAHRGKQCVAALLVNLDRFKVVNDGLGRAAGDELLKSAGLRMQRAVREGDTVARIAADEFAVLLTALERDEDALRVARNLLEELRRPFQVHEQDVFLSASIGLSCYPADGDTSTALLRAADVALSSARESGRNNVQPFAPGMNVRAAERLELEGALRRAMDQGALELYYQPIVDRRGGEVRQMEALVRWRHPQLGMLPPAEFLPVAEGMGLSDALDLWVVREACRQARAWRVAEHANLLVAVNMSARAFQQPELVSRIADQLRDTGLEPNALEIEITETIAMQNPAASAGVLRGLRELGVRIAIDDFGTGHSSLSYLRSLAVDHLKVDQSFVRDLPSSADAAAVTAAIIALAHSLRIDVVAEGVETEEQLDILGRHHCDLLQGFLISPPLPAADCAGFVRSRVRPRRPTPGGAAPALT